MLRLNLLGGFTVSDGDCQEIPIASRKAQALLAVLAVAAGTPITRDKITALLWSDRADAQARSSLRQALVELRKVLPEHEPPVLQAEREELRLDADLIQVDLLTFEHLTSDGSPDALTLAVEIYGGDFLDGLDVRDQAFEEWRREETEHLRQLAVKALETVLEGRSGETAIATAQRALDLDPLNEAMHRKLMSLFAGNGDRAMAIRQFEKCRRLLREHLGLELDEATLRLRDEIRATQKPPPLPPSVRGESASLPQGTARPSIVVAPFVQLAEGGEGQSLAAAISRELVTELGRMPTIMVVTSRGQSAGDEDDEPEPGQVPAQYIVEGSVQHASGRIRITAQLIDARAGVQIWSNRYDGDEDVSFQFQDEVVRQIAGNLYHPMMTHAGRRANETEHEETPAHVLYMKAFHHIERPTAASMRETRALCKRALQIDPGNALVYELLAWFHFHSSFNGWVSDPWLGLQAAKREVGRGLVFDDQNSVLRSSLGLAEVYTGNTDRGLDELRKAVVLSPSDPEPHTWLGTGLSFVGETDLAHESFDEAERLGPGYHPIFLFRGDAFFAAGHYGEAIACYDQFLTVLPEYNWALACKAACHVLLKDIEPARQALEQITGQSEFMSRHFIRRLLKARNPAFTESLTGALMTAGLPERATSGEPRKSVHTPLPSQPSIAVLPFAGLAGGARESVFCDGLTEDITTALSKVPGVFVVARASTAGYRTQTIDPMQVSREQGVRYILEGSVQTHNGNVRVNTQLTDSTTGNCIWAERYDRKIEDIFAVQDEITWDVVVALEVRLSSGDQARIWSSGTRNLEAWECIRQANDFICRGGRDRLSKAHGLCKRAIELDPSYPMAWVTLGYAHHHDVDVGVGATPGQGGELVLEKAVECARKACELDPSCADAYALLAMCRLSTGEFNQAIAMSDKAVDLAPSHAEIIAIAALVQNKAGRADRGLVLIEMAMRLCPIYPAWYLWVLGSSYRLTGEPERALEAFRTSAAQDPDYLGVRVSLASLLGELDRVEDAKGAARDVLRLSPDFSIALYIKGLNYRDKAAKQRFENGLRAAGLPE